MRALSNFTLCFVVRQGKAPFTLKSKIQRVARVPVLDCTDPNKIGYKEIFVVSLVI